MIEIKGKTSDDGRMDLQISASGPSHVVAAEAAAIITKLPAQIATADPDLFELTMEIADKMIDEMHDDEGKEATS